jgi:enoyl-CoA hydratase
VVVPSERLPDLIEALSGAAADDVTGLLGRFAEPPEPAPLEALRAEIDDWFGESSVERILSELERHDTEFAQGTAGILRQKSPTSLKVTLRQLRAGAHLGFEDCMRLEYRLACRFMQAQDFFEGVRAVVIDKDNKPAWRPDSLEAVSEAAVAAYFAPLPDGELTFD